MSLIQVSHLTFSYEGSYDTIFHDVSFQIDTDWKLGFIGRNGRGKTTFLNLLMGRYEYSGKIQTSVAFDYFPYPVFDPSLDTLQIINGICQDYALWELQRELSLLCLDDEVLYRPFNTLSNGERTKVLLAALFLNENHFLLIDEPTNHLDREGREVVSKYLNRKKGFILVSHDRTFLDGCIDHVLSLNKMDIEVQKGNFSSWQTNKERQDQFEQEENIRLKREIKQLTEAAKRTSTWSDRAEKEKGVRNSGLRPDRGFMGHKAAKIMKRAKTLESRQQEALEKKSGLLKNIDEAESLSLQILPYKQSRLAVLDGISIRYDRKVVCSDVCFTINRGDRVALTGRNGSGKSSLIKLLQGQEIPCSGELQLGGDLIISYVPQDTSFLKGSLKEFARKEGIDESLFKAILRKLDFSRIQFEKNMEDYSEGQKKKVLLAKSLSQPAHLFLWDEPLNFVDVLSRIQIENLILACHPTMVFVEHDGTFAERIATKTVCLS